MKKAIQSILNWIKDKVVINDDRKTFFFIMTIDGEKQIKVVKAHEEAEARKIVRVSLGRQRIPKNTKIIQNDI